MAISGLAALRFVNVAIYRYYLLIIGSHFFSTLRRLTTFIVIIGQFLIMNKTVPRDELNSVVLMVSGTSNYFE